MNEYGAEQAFQNFIETLAEDIQSPEALGTEAKYRLQNLVTLLETGDWVQDEAGNVYPSDLSEDDKQTVAENSRYSILDGPPRIEGFNTAFTWKAAGSLLCNVRVVVMYPRLTSFNLDASGSTMIDTDVTINF